MSNPPVVRFFGTPGTATRPYRLSDHAKLHFTTDLIIAWMQSMGGTDDEIARQLNAESVGGPYGAHWSPEFVHWAVDCL